MAVRQEVFHLPAAQGVRLCLWREPSAGGMRGLVVHVPAFAEEMNKARPMTAWAGRDLAGRGFGTLQIDLLGCGDSSGDFGDASWEAWIDDIVAGIAWARLRTNAPLWLWGLRGGALLASAVTHAIAEPTSLLLWQPVLSGKAHLTQFLRLKLAADLLDGGAERGAMQRMREKLRAGDNIEIAGYRLSSDLARGLDGAAFDPAAMVRDVIWLEVGATADATPNPVAQAKIDALRARGCTVTFHAVAGPGFWHSVETERCAALIEATSETMAPASHDAARDPILL
ncbi:MAG TPA: hydrolase 2, exosortase A system-associated [Acidobacteriaceae bacterium]|nr:hydrolase 2, exosortase A system-associated [Acidobacteriaceae bacterium]